jgi:hypothetical protein
MGANVQIKGEKAVKRRRKVQKTNFFLEKRIVIADFYVTLQPVIK